MAWNYKDVLKLNGLDSKTQDAERKFKKFDYTITATKFKDMVKITVKNNLGNGSDYAFYDGKELTSYSSTAVNYVNSALKACGLNPKSISPGYSKRFEEYY